MRRRYRRGRPRSSKRETLEFVGLDFEAVSVLRSVDYFLLICVLSPFLAEL